jgi:hypothetical protein
MDPAENVTLGEQVRRSKYGLGDRRTFAQLMEFSGVDPIHKATLRDRCGNIEYVPFKEHPLGADFIPRFDEVTFAPLDEPDEGSIYYQPSNAMASRTRSPEEKEKLFEKRNFLINQKNIKEENDKDKENAAAASAAASTEIPPMIRMIPEQQQQARPEDLERREAGLSLRKDENIWFDILIELSLLFVILIGCYYCTMLPSRSTKNL